MAELTADTITKSIKEKKKDPRMTSELKHEEAKADKNFLTKLRNGRDYWHIMTIGETEIPVRLLSIGETMDVLMETQHWFLSLPETKRVPDLWTKKHAINTLLKALSSTRHSEGDHKFFIQEQTLESLDDDIFLNLFSAYRDICEKYDLNVNEITDEEYKSMLEDLKKNPALVKGLSRPQSEQILLRLLEQVTTLMDNLHTAYSRKDITTG